jgi:hypothetical protein
METNNRQHEWEIYHSFFNKLYTDLAESICVPSKESQRDLMRIKKRFESEGLGFITKALPTLGKALDRALNRIEPLTVPTTFTRKVKCGVRQHIPNLFGYMFQRVIGEDGYPHGPDSMDIDCLRGLRQLVFLEYKLEMPHTPEQERELLDEFVKVDAELPDGNIWESEESGIDHILDTAAQIANAVFWNFNPRDIRPRHGPGAVATGEKTYEKHVFKRYYTGIHAYYSFDEYYMFSQMAVCDSLSLFEDLETCQTGTAKVVLVPKDSRGPRIISCEPLEYQWIQQGLGRAIVTHLESCDITAGRINFTDQSVNQQLALSGSKLLKWVTLDMKEASDRVSLALVRRIFSLCPDLLSALEATRTTHTELPDGRKVSLKKFAPMGSCLCFPVEAFVFWVLGVASIINSSEHCNDMQAIRKGRLNWPTLRTILLRARKCDLYVYGDDIIVGTKYHDCLLQSFPRYGLRFNVDKCCIRGLFRESCGVDAYDGVNVTPLRLKRRWNHRTVDARALSSYTEFSNLAYARGYKRVAAFAAALVEEKLGVLPINNRKTSMLSLIRPVSVIQIPPNIPRRYNIALQGVEYRVWTIRPQQYAVDPDSWCMVLRTQSGKVDLDEDSRLLTEIAQNNTPTGVFALSRRSCLKRVWTRIG